MPLYAAAASRVAFKLLIGGSLVKNWECSCHKPCCRGPDGRRRSCAACCQLGWWLVG